MDEDNVDFGIGVGIDLCDFVAFDIVEIDCGALGGYISLTRLYGWSIWNDMGRPSSR